ncbi:MAG TPA: NIPSNAP family protein [Burkholderiales bacterium]|nr:NIPSNAP family protein [Burkholderiales bacterium]
MIVEERMYTLHVGKVPEFMELYEKKALPLLRKHLGNQIGFYINEVGAQNLVVHLWAFESYEDREKRRHALASDPAWPEYRKLNQPRIQSQETRIMKPPAFFEKILREMIKSCPK